MRIPQKVEARVSSQLKRYQTIILDAKKRDINESDTGMIVADMVCDLLGYKKFEEITAEHAVRGGYVDLAVKVGSSVRFLIEVKAINIELKENHVTQAVNYAANLPVEWIVLTNAAHWQAYKVSFGKPIDRTLLLDIDLTTANPKATEVIEFFGGLSREMFTPDSMSQMFRAKQAMSKYSVAALLLCEPVVAMVRRELRKLADGLNPDLDEVRKIIADEVIKRELMETDDAKAAAKAVRKLERREKNARNGSSKGDGQDRDVEPPQTVRPDQPPAT
ncbi:MAG: type I restriction enzyme HsdR N-terminal domain-containing protein [Alphaproteobacteria bacterium]|nr:type I restriction enzyme HsdR N-terminal domain-containing protein [Alphaproteobacteria bacterium]